MEQTFKLSEASRILQVEPSTLRYWDNEGLIDIERDPQNNYRRLSLRALIAAGDIVSYRQLGLPLKQIAELSTLSGPALDRVLAQQSAALDEQIARLQATRKRLDHQRAVVAQAAALEDRAPAVAPTPLRRLVSFNARNPRHWQLAMGNPQGYAFRIDVDDEISCIDGVVDDGTLAEDEPLWEYDTDAVYLECLLKMAEEDNTRSNAADLFAQARAIGYQPQCMVGYYLATFNEQGAQIDRNRAWMVCYPLTSQHNAR